MVKDIKREPHEDCEHKRIEKCLHWQGFWWNLCLGCGHMSLIADPILMFVRKIKLPKTTERFPNFDENLTLYTTTLQEINAK